jgi:hypothetical protein
MMHPFAWIAAGVAALITAFAIMRTGGMIERPRREARIAPTGTGSPSGAGIPELGDDDDPFKIHPLRPREASYAGPDPLQTYTGELSNGGGWGSDTGEPAVSYESAGDGATTTPTPTTRPTSDAGPASAAWYEATGEPGSLPTLQPGAVPTVPTPTIEQGVYYVGGGTKIS